MSITTEIFSKWDQNSAERSEHPRVDNCCPKCEVPWPCPELLRLTREQVARVPIDVEALLEDAKS